LGELNVAGSGEFPGYFPRLRQQGELIVGDHPGALGFVDAGGPQRDCCRFRGISTESALGMANFEFQIAGLLAVVDTRLMENMVSEPEAATESDVRFPVVLRGYDRRQVDEYVRTVEKRVDRHEKARRVAERRLAKASVPLPRPPEADQASGLGRRIEKILAVAKAEAEEIKEQARKESEKLLAAAEKTATDAESARSETEGAAQQEAQLIVGRAEEEAAAIRTTHRAVLDELGQIATVVDDLRNRFSGETERACSAKENEVKEPSPSTNGAPPTV
jgi:DivIVA domain-containing protein